MRNTRNRVQDPLSFNSFPDSREVFPSNYSNPQSYYLSIPFRIPVTEGVSVSLGEFFANCLSIPFRIPEELFVDNAHFEYFKLSIPFRIPVVAISKR